MNLADALFRGGVFLGDKKGTLLTVVAPEERLFAARLRRLSGQCHGPVLSLPAPSLLQILIEHQGTSLIGNSRCQDSVNIRE